MTDMPRGSAVCPEGTHTYHRITKRKGCALASELAGEEGEKDAMEGLATGGTGRERQDKLDHLLWPG